MSDLPNLVTHRQLAVIEKIIQDETWLEGERRGAPVSPKDPVVLENVCGVVLRIGQELRDRLTADFIAARQCATQQDERDTRAA
ncbi:MAG: hypothetical protein HZA31_08020 [Opitutae bacterium]|nr:hypothetical protein [Opitutae bacterium]